MQRRPNLLEPGTRRGLVKASPGERGAWVGPGTTASLDQPSTGRPFEVCKVGARERRQIEQEKCEEERDV